MTERKKNKLLGTGALLLSGGAYGARVALKVGNAGLAYCGTAICVPPWMFILAFMGLFLSIGSILSAIFG